MRKILLFLGFLLVPTLFAQSPSGLIVIRVSGCSETPSNYFGVTYPNGVSYTRPAGGYLSIKDSLGLEIAMWAPGTWVRVEKNVTN